MEKPAISSLPNELLIDIFLLLLVESISMCKLVCKAWKNLIKDPIFTNLYPLKFTAFFLRNYELHCIFDDNNLKLRRLPTKASGRDRPVLLSESSNKIACFKSPKDNFLLHNLITNDSFKVTDAPFKRNPFYWVCYGFGYDSYDDDYKILLVLAKKLWSFCEYAEGYRFDMSSIDKETQNNNLVFIYSIRNRRWSLSSEAIDVGNEWLYPYIRKQGYCFNGVLHWVEIKKYADGFEIQRVAAIDLHRCKLGEILLPMEVASNSVCDDPIMFTELDGKLGFCDYKGSFDMWVMKEYGVESSWMKLIRIDILKICRICKFRPVFWERPTVLYRLGDDGKVGIFLGRRDDLELFWYDIAKDWLEVHQGVEFGVVLVT